MPIVFGSSDRDAESFASYFAEMPWHAFNFGDERIATLKSKYQVSGIPWLVVLNTKTGELVLNEADTMISEGSVAYAKWCETAAKLWNSRWDQLCVCVCVCTKEDVYINEIEY